MSLIDLKKSTNGPKKKKAFTVDEFIADAENYAKGKPEIVSPEKEELTLEQAILAAKKHVSQREDSTHTSSKRFRHATFTLSEAAIEQLQNLAIDSKLAKSHIIRILIDELCNEEQQEKIKKLLGSKIS